LIELNTVVQLLTNFCFRMVRATEIEREAFRLRVSELSDDARAAVFASAGRGVELSPTDDLLTNVNRLMTSLRATTTATYLNNLFANTGGAADEQQTILKLSAALSNVNEEIAELRAAADAQASIESARVNDLAVARQQLADADKARAAAHSRLVTLGAEAGELSVILQVDEDNNSFVDTHEVINIDKEKEHGAPSEFGTIKEGNTSNVIVKDVAAYGPGHVNHLLETGFVPPFDIDDGDSLRAFTVMHLVSFPCLKKRCSQAPYFYSGLALKMLFRVADGASDVLQNRSVAPTVVSEILLSHTEEPLKFAKLFTQTYTAASFGVLSSGTLGPEKLAVFVLTTLERVLDNLGYSGISEWVVQAREFLQMIVNQYSSVAENKVVAAFEHGFAGELKQWITSLHDEQYVFPASRSFMTSGSIQSMAFARVLLRLDAGSWGRPQARGGPAATVAPQAQANTGGGRTASKTPTMAGVQPFYKWMRMTDLSGKMNDTGTKPALLCERFVQLGSCTKPSCRLSHREASVDEVSALNGDWLAHVVAARAARGLN
jgi:hypothetical protein